MWGRPLQPISVIATAAAVLGGAYTAALSPDWGLTGRLGALLVEMPSGQRFRLGAGFSDADRDNPPPVGSWVTYRYRGTHDGGLPRFASFVRVRLDMPAVRLALPPQALTGGTVLRGPGGVPAVPGEGRGLVEHVLAVVENQQRHRLTAAVEWRAMQRTQLPVGPIIGTVNQAICQGGNL